MDSLRPHSHLLWQGLSLDEQRRFLVRTMREDAERSEEYFTRLLAQQVEPLAAPIICVVGERDPGTEFYRERYREWGVLTTATGLAGSGLSLNRWSIATFAPSARL